EPEAVAYVHLSQTSLAPTAPAAGWRQCSECTVNACNRSASCSGLVRMRTGRCQSRQQHGEPRSAFGCVGGLDVAAEATYQARSESRSEPGAALPDAPVTLVECAALEPHRQVCVGETGPTVAHLDRAAVGQLGLGTADGQHDGCAGRYHAQRVLQQAVD